MADEDNGNPARSESAKKPAGRPPQLDTISFVAFEGSSNDASRKAVRKQAALSSAAARKATIAKKMAKQKEQEQRQAEELKRTGKLAQVTPVKRQKKTDGPRRSEEPWQSSISIMSMQSSTCHTKSDTGYSLAQKPSSVPWQGIVPAYPQENDDWEDDTRASCAVVLSKDDRAHLALPRKQNNWTVMADDFNKLPPTPESLASPGSAGASMHNSLNQYPVPYHPVYDKLLYHMMTVFAPRAWPSLNITNEEGLDWENFMVQQSFAEPALFYVRLMFASGDMIRMGVLEPNTVVKLRGMAINAINEALKDEKRSTSDGLILAIGRIAFTEALYGDKSVASTLHRPAQRRMIDLRGGMAGLDFPPLIKRLMRFIDRIMSIQDGTPRLLPDDEEVGHTSWSTTSAVKVLEAWVPQEAQDIRKKIAIADLIT